MNVWVTGARGMLGQDLVRVLEGEGVQCVGTDLDVDITRPAAVADHMREAGPFEWIINCAAYTAVDAAESDPDRAELLNAQGPAVLADATRLAAGEDTSRRGAGTAILHLSTDHVFHGCATSPYTTAAAPGPRSVYGRTKLAGEDALRRTLAEHVILRTAWLYGDGGNNFVKTMLRLMRERDTIRVVADQRGAPTWTRDLASAITRIVTSGTHRQGTLYYGTYHFTNSGETTWYEFAREIQRLGSELGLVGGECTIEPITTEEYPTPAARPAYSVLSLEEIERDYGIIPPHWQESLEQYLQEETKR